MSGTATRPLRVTISRDAVKFIDRVEATARAAGCEQPHLHHWVAAACEHSFLAKTVATGADVRAAGELVRTSLAAGALGPAWASEAVLEAARETVLGRGDTQVHVWHLVRVALKAFGVATRATVVDARPDANELVVVPPVAPPAAGPLVPVRERLPRGRARRPRPATPLLDQCGVDWAVLAARGELPPCVGRDAEMRLLVEALCRPTKPNALLVGEPGVGKSAIVEGLAQRMADGDVPAVLLGRPLIAVALSELTRDSRWYGVMEQRLGALIEEARAVRAIVFLDEGHAMTGAGGREGTGDVASVFKPALARGDFSLISATTGDEYRRFIAPNGALERRFNVIHVLEPERTAVRVMLAAHRERIAVAHGVHVPDAALDRLIEVTATRLSHRREPDRSRDLLDQVVAGAIAADADTATADDVEAAARSVSGAPDVDDATLGSLRDALGRACMLSEADAAALVERLGIAYAGLTLRPQRPKAVVLLLRRPGGADGLALAEAVATHVFGAPERVIAVDVGAIKEPSAISGFLGTTQGFIGHGAALPIHALAERPHSVLVLRGVDAAHEALRNLLARAIHDGHLTDAQARRIPLSAAIVVLEATAPERPPRSIGFGTAAGGAGSPAGPGAPAGPAGRAPAGPGRSPAGPAAVGAGVVGDELAGACDLVAEPPAAGAGGEAAQWLTAALGRLAEAYRAAGVELTWDAEVEGALEAVVAPAPTHARERVLEVSLGRVVRPCLRPGRRPARARVRQAGEGLVAELEGG
jgi:ATP-dependent Clp protease ATP-binding subunit ClpC